MNRLAVLQRTIDKIDAKIYLEIGIREGKIISQLTVPHKIGLDPKLVYSIKDSIRKHIGLTKYKPIKDERD
ncbi:MAG: class I SAM-dependent methyltransferase, partial [bacterium]